jgi:hypothetical protein
VKFFELYHAIEAKHDVERLAMEVHNNFEQMDPLEVIGRVRQLSIYAAHEPYLTEHDVRLLTDLVEALMGSEDMQIRASAQQLWGQLDSRQG